MPRRREILAIPFAKAVVLSPERGAILLQRRVKPGDRYDGCWELPGGRIRSGETVGDALRREVEEETGLRVIEILDQPVEDETDGRGGRARLLCPLVCVETTAAGRPIFGHYFVCRAEGEPRATKEGGDHRWLGADLLEKEFLKAGGELTMLDRVALRAILPLLRSRYLRS